MAMIRIKLSTLLGERRMSQRELSRKTGIRYATIHEYYNEFAERVKLEYLDLICEVLHCELSDLLVREDRGEPEIHERVKKFAK